MAWLRPMQFVRAVAAAILPPPPPPPPPSHCGWTEDAGSWAIVSNTLQTSSTNAIVRSNTAHPDGTGQQRLTVDVKSSATDDLVRVIIGYVDLDNYHFAELKIGASGYLKLWKRSGGVNTELQTKATAAFTTGSFVNVSVCLTRGLNSISVTAGSEVIAKGTTVPGSADEFALATGGTVTGTVTFDNFVSERTGPSETCPNCVAVAPNDCPSNLCDGDIFSLEYLVEFSGWANGTCGTCTDMNTTAYLLGFSDTAHPLYPCGWISTPTICASADDMILLIYNGGGTKPDLDLNMLLGPNYGFLLAESSTSACTEFVREALPRSSGAPTICDNTAATAYVSAQP